ncbi:MAG TPA: SMI1/KNR4 family protein [Candidatus Obscuribacterales bacterium]
MSVQAANTIEESWTIIHGWLEQNAPEILANLNNAADQQAVTNLESTIQITLPPDFVASTRIHDGQTDQSIGFEEGGEFLSLKRIADEWKVWKELLDSGDFAGITSEPVGAIKNDWWNPKWIPFTYDGSGNHLCIDLDPAAGGTPGQIITMWHDDADRRIVAPNFQTWLSNLAIGLQNGDFVYSDNYGAIVPKEDA